MIQPHADFLGVGRFDGIQRLMFGCDHPPMLLPTPRLTLRNLEIGDIPALNAVERDVRVTRYMSFDVQSLDDTRRYVEADLAHQSADPRTVYDLAIVPRDGATLIGRCGLHIQRPAHHEAMLWYSLRPDLWGRGYATEAATALIDFAFGPLGLHRVYADCDPRNEASVRVALRLGMTLEGRLRENYFLKGEWCDSQIFGLLAREWQARPAPCR